MAGNNAADLSPATAPTKSPGSRKQKRSERKKLNKEKKRHERTAALAARVEADLSTNANNAAPPSNQTTSTPSVVVAAGTSMVNTAAVARPDKQSTGTEMIEDGLPGQTPAAKSIGTTSDNKKDDTARGGTEKRKPAGSPGRTFDGIAKFDGPPTHQQPTRKVSQV